MSAATGGRRIGLWLALGAIAVVGIVAVGRGGSGGAPLDPDGTGPAGAKALVLLLEQLGAEVDVVAVPDDRHDVAFVLDDRFGEQGRLVVDEWIDDDGGVLVVADRFSSYAPPANGPGFGSPGRCTLAAVVRVGEIDADDLIQFQAEPDDAVCFGDRFGGAVVSRASGTGTVVAVGSRELFLNGVLGDADNSVLAAALLAPRPGTRVAFVHGALVGSGQRALADLVDEGIKWGLVQLGIAFVVLAVAKGRRLGRAIEEDLPVELAGSELTTAVGHLLERTRQPGRVAERLQRDLHGDLVRRLGLGADAPPGVVASTVAARTGLDAETVHDTLTRSVVDDDGLILVSRRVAALRDEIVLGRPAPRPAESTPGGP